MKARDAFGVISSEMDQNKNFERVVWEGDENINTELSSISVSDKYNIRTQTSNKDKPIFTNSLDETIDIIKSYNNDKEFVRIIYNDYLEGMLFGIINKLNYTSDIKMMNGKIISLTVKYNDTVFIITLSDTKQNDTDVWISEEDFELYHDVDDNFYNGLICYEHMSYYNDVTKNIESILPIGPKSGYFSEHVTRPLLGIDARKAYTSDYMDVKFYPVFNNFDI